MRFRLSAGKRFLEHRRPFTPATCPHYRMRSTTKRAVRMPTLPTHLIGYDTKAITWLTEHCVRVGDAPMPRSRS
ncbi:hypothetical protein QE152_g31032 [Popillia japonica]|uniref:Uncharacterized protein n=1 Tax=Popillia japonica TaxID=7064 RepID=A0AAW1JD03_POPJA